MDKVMGGIAEALIATGVGLFVAIPAVVAYNVFQKKITDIEDNVSSIGKRLCALLASQEALAADDALSGLHTTSRVRETAAHSSRASSSHLAAED
jgi:biopolymer transport protein ExbB/biopolymer transport protein TolQ